MALEAILRLDVAQKNRVFFADKWDLKKKLKRRVLGLTTFKSACKGQCSRITNLNEGYVNILTSESTIEEEEQKNIHRLKHGPGWVTIHEHKEVVVQKHLSTIMKKEVPRQKDFNWDCIPKLICDLWPEIAFSEEEAKSDVFDLSGEKASNLDGFINAFFKAC